MKPHPKLIGEEEQIWEALGDDAVHIDVLGRKMRRSPAQLAASLLKMELKGLLRQLPGMRYIRN